MKILFGSKLAVCLIKWFHVLFKQSRLMASGLCKCIITESVYKEALVVLLFILIGIVNLLTNQDGSTVMASNLFALL